MHRSGAGEQPREIGWTVRGEALEDSLGNMVYSLEQSVERPSSRQAVEAEECLDLPSTVHNRATRQRDLVLVHTDQATAQQSNCGRIEDFRKRSKRDQGRNQDYRRSTFTYEQPSYTPCQCDQPKRVLLITTPEKFRALDPLNISVQR